MRNRLFKVVMMMLIALLLLPAFCSAETASGETEQKKSGIPSLYLISDDPVNQGREWVEASADKSNKAKGTYKMVDADGTELFSGKLKQIKGRGNYTWTCEKKPYQIKLGAEEDLLETGWDSEKSGTWVLLANYCDDTLLKNQITYTIAKKIGLDHTPECRQVDLYYDGEYRGVYLLTEKVQIGQGRIEINDLEAQIKDANKGTDLDALKTAAGVTADGNLCQYVDGVQLPESYEGGYLLEIDYTNRAKAEKTWFISARGQAVTVKSPEYLPLEGVDRISSLYQEFEDAVYNGGISPETGRKLEEIMDLDSLAKVYLIEELSQDVDAFMSSNYFYKPENENKLYAGPVWDFDNAYISSNNTEGLGAGRCELGAHLLTLPEFQRAVKKVYRDSFYNAVNEVATKDLKTFSQLIRVSTVKNSELWPNNTVGDASTEQDTLGRFILSRNSYLRDLVRTWDGTAASVRNGNFFDVYPDDWYYESVMYVGEKGVFSGGFPGYFDPKDSMTRSMVTSVLYRSAGSPVVDNRQIFDDVKPEAWYAASVNWAFNEKIVYGVSVRKFAPGASITRQDFLTILYRVNGSPKVDTGNLQDFRDDQKVSGYARDAMSWAVAESIIVGDGNRQLIPTATLSRAQAAAILYRIEQKEKK